MGRDSGGSEPVRDALFSPNHRKAGGRSGEVWRSKRQLSFWFIRGGGPNEP